MESPRNWVLQQTDCYDDYYGICSRNEQPEKLGIATSYLKNLYIVRPFVEMGSLKRYKKEYLKNKKCQQLLNNFNSVVAGIFFNYMSLEVNDKK